MALPGSHFLNLFEERLLLIESRPQDAGDGYAFEERREFTLIEYILDDSSNAGSNFEAKVNTLKASSTRSLDLTLWM